jgi:6-phosphogluconolactonase
MAETLGDVAIVETPAALADEAAELFIRAAAEAVGDRGRFVVALAGGATPRGLYTRLAGEPARSRVDWGRAWVFFGDERCVPPTDPESNYRMAWQTLLSVVPVPAAQVFRIRGEADPAQAAAEYEATLRTVFEPGPPRCDLILLGMGLDGHVASLFPGSAVLEERDRLVAAVDQRAAVVSRRVTLTLPAINAARRVLFLIAGSEKARAVAGLLRNPASTLPAARVRPTDGAVTLLLDRAAAAGL